MTPEQFRNYIEEKIEKTREKTSSIGNDDLAEVS